MKTFNYLELGSALLLLLSPAIMATETNELNLQDVATLVTQLQHKVASQSEEIAAMKTLLAHNTADLNSQSEKIECLEQQANSDLVVNTSAKHRHLAETLDEVIAKTACISDFSDSTKLFIDASCSSNLQVDTIDEYPCFEDTDTVVDAVDDVDSAEIVYGPIYDWCFDEMNLDSVFEGGDGFNKDIGGWDVSKVTSMDFMFGQNSNFNQDISQWNVSSVTSMAAMFYQAIRFNSYIGDWDVSKVTNFNQALREALAFNQPLSNWDTSQATNMDYMFWGTSGFDQDISSWDVSSVTTAKRFLTSADDFNQDLCDWQSKLPKSCVVDDMFDGTDCPEDGTPELINDEYWNNLCYACDIPYEEPSISPTTESNV